MDHSASGDVGSIQRDALVNAAAGLREQSRRLYEVANKIVTTQYALEVRSIAGAITSEADRIANLARDAS